MSKCQQNGSGFCNKWQTTSCTRGWKSFTALLLHLSIIDFVPEFRARILPPVPDANPLPAKPPLMTYNATPTRSSF